MDCQMSSVQSGYSSVKGSDYCGDSFYAGVISYEQRFNSSQDFEPYPEANSEKSEDFKSQTFPPIDPREIKFDVTKLDSEVDHKKLADILKELEDSNAAGFDKEFENGQQLSKQDKEEMKWRIKLELSRRQNAHYTKMKELVKNDEEIYIDSMQEFVADNSATESNDFPILNLISRKKEFQPSPQFPSNSQKEPHHKPVITNIKYSKGKKNILKIQRPRVASYILFQHRPSKQDSKQNQKKPSSFQKSFTLNSSAQSQFYGSESSKKMHSNLQISKISTCDLTKSKEKFGVSQQSELSQSNSLNSKPFCKIC